MSERKYTDSSRQKLEENHINKLLSKASFAGGMSKDIVQRFIDKRLRYGVEDFCKELKEGEKPSEFVERTDFKKVLHICIPDKTDREKYLSIIDKSNIFQYSKYHYRRSIRTRNYAPSIASDIKLMYDYYLFGIYECSLSDYLRNNIEEEKLDFKKHINNDFFIFQGDMLIAAELDYDLAHGKDKLHKTIEDIILGENNTSAITTNIIRGIIKSSDTKLHELLAKFLLAARLQEGVRQAICESLDCGTHEAFMTIFNVISDNNLIRYSSVKRAVATWVGLFDEKSAERISAKTMTLMKQALYDENARKEMLSTDDAMKIIIALWATGFYEADDAVVEIQNIIKSGTKAQLLAAAYYNQELYSRDFYAPCAEYAVEKHSDDMEIVAAFFPTYLENISAITCAWWYEDNKDRPSMYRSPLRQLPELWFNGVKEKASLHVHILKDLFDRLEKKEKVFSPSTFPWYSVSISKQAIADRACIIAARFPGVVPREIAYQMIEAADSFISLHTIKSYLNVREIKQDRDFAVKLLANKNLSREVAKLLDSTTPSQENILYIESLLRYKDSNIRNTAGTIISEQGDEEFTQSVFRLLKAKEEGCRFAALDFIMRLKEENENLAHKDVDWKQFKDAVLAIKSPSTREEPLIKNLFGTKGNSIEENNDEKFPDSLDGLFDTDKITEIPPTELKLDTDTLNLVCKADKKKIVSIIKAFDKLIDAHRTDQYKDCFGTDRMLGDKESYNYCKYGYINTYFVKKNELPINSLPFKELWIKFYDEYIKNQETLFQLFILCNLPGEISRLDFVVEKVGSIFLSHDVENDGSQALIIEKAVNAIFGELCNINPGTYEYFCPRKSSLFSQIINVLIQTYCKKDFLDKLMEGIIYRLLHSLKYEDMWYWNISFQNKKNRLSILYSHDLFGFLSSVMPSAVSSKMQDDEFSKYFKIRYALLRHAGFEKENPDKQYHSMNVFNTLQATDYFRAYKLGLISLDTVYYGIIRISPFITNMQEPLFFGTDDAGLFEIYRHISDTIIENELRRGDAEGSCTNYAKSLNAIYGGRNVLRLIQALGSSPFARNESYGEDSKSRHLCLSHLISVSRPLPCDTAESFKAMVKEFKTKEQKLYDLAMYAPTWIPIISKVLGLPDFERGCYYFIAHMKVHWCDHRDASLIAKYTPLTLDELNRGAFDLDWFTEMYNTLGEDVFNKLYQSAKYISSGTQHSRARKFADAALGRVTEEELEKEIERARNKDLVMSYPLIPIKQTELNERVLHRYEFLQKFKKESRNFGAQRRQSEGEAFDIALENLSRAAGYTDVNRLNLNMECRLMESLCSVFDFQETKNKDYSIRIATDEKGKPFVECRNNKEEKILKSVPSSLKKDELVLEIQETYKRLKTQHERTRAMLENFMTESVYIPAEEIAALQKNPVISPITSTLLFISDKENPDSPVAGFLTVKDENYLLTSYDDSEAKIVPECLLRIAHPFDLFKGGHWHDWQKYIFEKQIIQPFKQVFRELYVKLSEELDKDRSYMFAGNQIQPKKAVATLRGRRWIAGYEEGLQKVFYKQNLIAEIYAQADWFSPADIECPAVEFVGFSRRLYKAGNEENPLRIRDIPDIVYSEIMRDVDLAVSVAHAGGVDPETSHSTIEMRRAVCEFSLPLFKIQNVRFDKNFAIITGTRKEYSVHLGTGLVRVLSGSAINIVAVNSQQRGKIFLPFADEDPKTAEVLSKVIMFARDEKIKDPYILEQIESQ